MSTLDKFLSELARDNSQVSGDVGNLLRARVAQQASADLIHDTHLAHARAREAVVTIVRMALRCGLLLIKTGGDWGPVLRATGISEQAAAGYVALALSYPDLAVIASRRKWRKGQRARITEAQALEVLQRGPVASPIHDLRALRGIVL